MHVPPVGRLHFPHEARSAPRVAAGSLGAVGAGAITLVSLVCLFKEIPLNLDVDWLPRRHEVSPLLLQLLSTHWSGLSRLLLVGVLGGSWCCAALSDLKHAGDALSPRVLPLQTLDRD